MKEKLYLIGFMGSGKSSIGESLAKALDYEWIDLDEMIEKQQGCSIKEIFATHGETYFRHLEAQVLKESSSRRKHIISTGGGIIMAPNNRIFLKNQHAIYLEWPFETLYKRISQDEGRPLVQSYSQLLELYHLRELLYEEAATHMIRGEGKSKEILIEEIIEWMEM